VAMALKVDVAKACKKAGWDKPVDLVHLSHQTMGDRGLEREVLDIFLGQAKAYIESWHSNSKPEARRRIAHSLKGAARGIGAWELAHLSALAEEPEFSDIAALERETARVCAYILSLRMD
jgi:HPt (histidine-containing phosphotransfer) domain-containing protein